jgi:hypothetical protein
MVASLGSRWQGLARPILLLAMVLPAATVPRASSAAEPAPAGPASASTPVPEPSPFDLPTLPRKRPPADKPPVPSGKQPPDAPAAKPESKPETAKPVRLPVPKEEARKQALARVHEAFRDGYADTKRREQKLALAEKLLQNGRETKDDPASRYVLYEEALELAVAARHIKLAARVIDVLSQEFEVDGLALKADNILGMNKGSMTPEDRIELAWFALTTAEEALRADRFDVAERMLAHAVGVGMRSRTNELAKAALQWQKDLKTLKTQAEAGRIARATLAKTPDDPEAHLQLGRYLCFRKGGWETGLGHLLRGGDVALRDLAKRTLAGAEEPAAQFELGSRWWDTAGKLERADQSRVQAYAAQWYRKSLPGLAGLSLATAKQRVEQVDAVRPQRVPRVINLLKYVDPKRDSVQGTWILDGGVLASARSYSSMRLQIPYQPPEEYDFKIVFGQSPVRNPVAQVMPKGGASFSWELGGRDGVAAFSVNKGTGENPTQKSFPGAFLPNRKYTSLVQVRNGSVRAFVDGKPVAEYKTDYADMKARYDHELRDKNLLGVACSSFTVFYAIELVEVTGQGKPTLESP